MTSSTSRISDYRRLIERATSGRRLPDLADPVTGWVVWFMVRVSTGLAATVTGLALLLR